MSQQWDEFSKSLSEPVPRRESLRLLGAAIAGAVLSPLGFGTAKAAPKNDPCKAFCRCSSKKDQNACLTACRACNGDTSRLCGFCGNYACTDFDNDGYNCGACGYECDEPGPNEYGACIDGRCEYACVEGADYCDGTCTFLNSDPDNCGACGHVCGGSTPYCSNGVCITGDEPCPGGGTRCNGICTNLAFDTLNCGGCGIRCGYGETCSGGVCQSPG